MIELVVRVSLSLLVVFLLMWLLARLARRPLSRRTGGALSVLYRQQLSRGSAVAVVQVAERALVVGITEQRVNLLVELEPDELDRYAAAEEARRHAPVPWQPDGVLEAEDGPLAGSALSRHTWTQAVETLRARTVRK